LHSKLFIVVLQISMGSDQYLICYPLSTELCNQQRKRRYEEQNEEHFQASKRFICENFWKLRITPESYLEQEIRESKHSKIVETTINENEDEEVHSNSDHNPTNSYKFSEFYLTQGSCDPTNQIINSLLHEQQRKWQSSGYEIVVYNPDSLINCLLRNNLMTPITPSTLHDINSGNNYEGKKFEKHQQIAQSNNYNFQGRFPSNTIWAQDIDIKPSLFNQASKHTTPSSEETQHFNTSLHSPLYFASDQQVWFQH